MDAGEIITRLEEPADDEQAVHDELRDSAPLSALVEALGTARDGWTRMLVADLLGDRGDPAALDALVAALDDPDERVRWSVADALRKLLLVERESARPQGDPAGRQGGSAGREGGSAGQGDPAGREGGSAGQGDPAGREGGSAGREGDAAGREGGSAGREGDAAGREGGFAGREGDAARAAGGDRDAAGRALLARYEVETAPEVRRPLASALGAARHRPAIPALRAALSGDDPALVFCARVALHRLGDAPPVAAEEVVDLLERPVHDGRPLSGRLLLEAPTAVLATALAHARRTATRHALADLLGFRGDARALDALLDALDDPDPGVRASVADALGKLVLAAPPPPSDALQRTGAALLARFEREPSPGVRRTLASAVGAARHLPAAPALRRALTSDDPSLVRAARWGLHWLEGTPPPEAG